MGLQERINHRIANIGKWVENWRKKSRVGIARYLDKKLVLFLDVDDREEALNILIESLNDAGKLRDKEQFKQAIFSREEVVSTGVGMGVAVPHAKLEGYDDFFIAIGVQRGKGIDWNALDGAAVHLIFMIGGPEDRQGDYLEILSKLTSAIKDEERRKKLLKTRSNRQVIDLFAEC